jgi:2,4-dienoyl-CoA reductase-like NADH-dependent reductase (Old Yellow Enzyme family)
MARAPYPHLFAPLVLRGRRLRNRIVSTAHNPNWDPGGGLSERHIGYLARKAEGGAGLIMCFGSANVYPPAAAAAASIRLWDPANEPALRDLASRVHAHGALLMAQATHRGHRASSAVTGRPAQAPSEVAQPTFREIPHVLTTGEIKEVIRAFGAAARRLEACGWDGIEITSFGGHLIEQFWSPTINRRTDAYGGDAERRMRFSLEVLETVAAAVSERFLIAFRLSGDPLTDRIGLTPDDMLAIAARLCRAGRIDLLNISGGTGFTLETQAATVPPDTFPRGCYLPLARRVKERLPVPVLAAGRILDPAQAEAALAAGDCDLVALTRAIIADPDLPRKAEAGQDDAIRPCIAINEGCIGRDFLGLPMLCAVNPAIAAADLEVDRSAPPRQRVAVVGGGPAGMEAARAAAIRGHRVVLFESEGRLGGQLVVAARAPERPHLGRYIPWMERELSRLHVEVRLGTEAGSGTVLEWEPDRVIVATGAETALPDEARRVEAPCATDVDLLLGRAAARPGMRVVVYDAEGLNRGGSIANLAAESGAEVELITTLGAPCADLDPTQLPSMMRRLARNKVVCTPNQVLIDPVGGALAVRDQWSDVERRITGRDLVVFVGYRTARSGFAAALLQAQPELAVVLVGDCLAPRRLHDAVAEGARAGSTIGAPLPAARGPR